MTDFIEKLTLLPKLLVLEILDEKTPLQTVFLSHQSSEIHPINWKVISKKDTTGVLNWVVGAKFSQPAIPKTLVPGGVGEQENLLLRNDVCQGQAKALSNICRDIGIGILFTFWRNPNGKYTASALSALPI